MSTAADIERTIGELKAKYPELKRIAASIMVRRDEIAAQVEEAKAERAKIDQALELALDTDDDDRALGLMQSQENHRARVAGLIEELEQAQTDLDGAKNGLEDIKKGIRELEAAKPRAVVQSARDLLGGVSVDAELTALENARSHIHDTLAVVALNRELAGEDDRAELDRKIAELKKPQAQDDLKAQLAALKAQRGRDTTKKM